MRRRIPSAWKYPRSSVRGSSRIMNMSLSSLRIQCTSGSEKPCFCAIERFARHADALGKFSQDVFLRIAAQLPFRRQTGDPLDELVVEDRNAHFERIQHAHAIDFGKDVADHIGFGVDIESWLTGSFAGAAAK